MNLAAILESYSEKLHHFRRVEKLYNALAQHAYDGTELFAAIDRALPGLENATIAATIKAAAKSHCSNSIQIDIAIELFMKFLEEERHV